MEYLLDTNICIYIINKKPAIVIENKKASDFVGGFFFGSLTIFAISPMWLWPIALRFSLFTISPQSPFRNQKYGVLPS